MRQIHAWIRSNSLLKSVTIGLLVALCACSAFGFSRLVRTPGIIIAVPEQVATRGNIEQAVFAAGQAAGWNMHKVHRGLIQADKAEQNRKVSVYVVYGYAGYSIEYHDSQNMQYDDDRDIISVQYVYWVSQLNQSIEHQLQQLA